MAKSKFRKFRGVASYAMLYSPDEYNDKRFWKLNLHVTKEVEKEIRDAGLQNKFKEDKGNIENASGQYFTFKRDTEKKFEDTTYFCPPQVLDKDGKKLVYYKRDGNVVQSYNDGDRPERVGEPVLIGNGSEVEVTLEIYPTRRFGNGSRLVSVRIIDLIEYNPDNGDADSDDASDDVVRVEKEVPDLNTTDKPVEKKKAKLDW